MLSITCWASQVVAAPLLGLAGLRSSLPRATGGLLMAVPDLSNGKLFLVTACARKCVLSIQNCRQAVGLVGSNMLRWHKLMSYYYSHTP